MIRMPLLLSVKKHIQLLVFLRQFKNKFFLLEMQKLNRRNSLKMKLLIELLILKSLLLEILDRQAQANLLLVGMTL